ncbi:MAG: hypothetical protein WB682_14605 [Candidatus Dormiibacterota bacterium]
MLSRSPLHTRSDPNSDAEALGSSDQDDVSIVHVGEGGDTTKTLAQLQVEIIKSAKRGYPILISGAAFFALIAALGRVIPLHTLGLAWIFGMMVIFPLGGALGSLLNARVITTGNPLGNLGGLVAGTQAFFIPVFIVIYQFVPQYLPLAVGLLGGAHFLPYAWIYRSRAYVFVTLGTCLSALVLGTAFVSVAYTVVPLGMAAVFAIAVFWIVSENRRDLALSAGRKWLP